jgi:hypothetical protein
MTVPAKTKTWQVYGNLRSYLRASIEDTSKEWLLLIKNTLTGAASGAWDVESCSDSVAVGNNDQVDRWADISDIEQGTGAHSWVVLKQPGLGNEASICWDCNDTATNLNEGSIVYSGKAGFGTANGGTDGTTSARPTATDEIVLVSNYAWNPNRVDQVMHIWLSEDGTQTWINNMAAGTQVNTLALCGAKSPVAGWDPALFAHVASGDRWVYAELLAKDTYVLFEDDALGLQGNFYMATPGYLTTPLGQQVAGKFPHALTGGYIMTPIVLASKSAGLGGVWGSAFDVYFGPNTLNNGTLAKDASDDVQFALFGDLWLPWTNALGVVQVS